MYVTDVYFPQLTVYAWIQLRMWTSHFGPRSTTKPVFFALAKYLMVIRLTLVRTRTILTAY